LAGQAVRAVCPEPVQAAPRLELRVVQRVILVGLAAAAKVQPEVPVAARKWGAHRARPQEGPAAQTLGISSADPAAARRSATVQAVSGSVKKVQAAHSMALTLRSEFAAVLRRVARPVQEPDAVDPPAIRQVARAVPVVRALARWGPAAPRRQGEREQQASVAPVLAQSPVAVARREHFQAAPAAYPEQRVQPASQGNIVEQRRNRATGKRPAQVAPRAPLVAGATRRWESVAAARLAAARDQWPWKPA
jgi:hypothetical protein